MDFWIDGKYFQDETINKNIIQKCFEARIDVPFFCYHEALNIAGSCRMCLVEIANSPKLVASCAMPLSHDMKVYTLTERVKKARESVLEFLLVNHPLDCPICDQGGECDLQDITLVFGSDRSRFYEYEKRAVFDKDVGPFIKMIMTRCIHCTRCIRFFEEICHVKDFGILGRGVSSEISTYIKMSIVHELSGNVIDLCPVGALTSLPYSFSARPWELNNLESIDILDSACSSIRVDYLNNKIMRILPIYNKNINEDWISNKIRFVYDSNLNQRINHPLININNKYITLSWLNTFFLFFSKLYTYALDATIISFAGNLIDLNSLSNMKNFFNFIGTDISLVNNKYFFNFDFINDIIFDFLINFENLKYILFIGLNLRLEVPVLNSRLLKYNNLKLYNIGLLNSYNFSKIKTIGNNIVSVLNIIKGKNLFNKLLFFNSYLNSAFCFYQKISNICFFFGSSFYNFKFSFFVFKYIKNLFFDFFNSFCLNIFNNIGILNFYLLGINKPYNLNKSAQFIFIESVDDFLFLSKLKKNLNTFIVYRGSFFDNGAKYSSLVIPSLTFFESVNYYYNYQGLLRNSKKIIHNELESSNDFYLYLISFFKLYFLNNFCIIKKIFNLLKFFKFLKINFKYIKYNNNFYNHNFNLNLNIFYVENKILSSTVFNFYKTDVYSRVSKNLHLASLDYLKLLNIFN